MPANNELPVIRGKLTERQPIDVGLQKEEDTHHIPDIGVQVIHKLTILRRTYPIERSLNASDKVVEICSSGFPLRSAHLPLLLVVRGHDAGVRFQPVKLRQDFHCLKM